MSQLSIQSPLADQTLATVPAQGSGTSSTIQEKPAALLARLSGSGKDKPAFDPAYMHRDSYLPHVDEALASRPLGDSEGAKAAAEALELVESLQGKPVTKEDLAQLEELRARAWQSDKSGEAGKYCDTLAKVLLLRPMMEKLETVQPPEARAQLADVLHTQLDRLLSVTTQEQVEQIRSELRGTLELYRQEGMLGPEQNAAFDRLDELLSYREECMTTLAKLQKSAEQVRNGEASAPQLGNVLNDVEVRDNRMKAESPVPPLRPGFQPLQIEAEMLASDLYLFSKEKAGEFSKKIDDLLARIRNSGISQENVGKERDALNAELEKMASVLTEYDRLELQNQIDCLAGAVDVRERVARGASTLQQVWQGGVTAPQLEALQAELGEGIADLALNDVDRDKLEDILTQLGNRGRELREAAHQSERQIAIDIERGIRQAATPEQYDGLAKDINNHLERLNNLPESGNLSPEAKDEAVTKLKDLAQQCLVAEFAPLLANAQSTRHDVPSISQCAERLNELSEQKGIDKTEIEKKLTDISAKAAAELVTEIDNTSAGIPKMTAEQLRMSLTDIAEAMERHLLPADRESLAPKLEALISQAEEVIFEKTVGPELEGTGAFASLDASQKTALKELCIQGGCHPSLIAALKDAAADPKDPGRLGDTLEVAGRIFTAQKENGTPDPKDIEQLDAFLLPHPELDDVARDILGSKGAEPDYRFESVRNSRDLGIYMDRHFPKAMRRKLGLEENAPVGTDTLRNLVQQAATAHGRQGRRLKEVDLTLIQVLWTAEKARNPNLSFDDFKAGLPDPFNTMPMLQNNLDAGISGRRELKKLGETVEGISLGLGSKKTLVRFLAQAQAADPKWAAGAALSGLYRSLGLNPHSSLEGIFEGTVKDTQGGKTAEQKEHGAEAALGAAHGLRLRKAELEDADRAVRSDPRRTRMANRLGISPETRNPNMEGATLATGILMTEKILSDPETSNAQKQQLLNGVHFQKHCRLAGKTMRGSTLGSDDTLGKDFRETLRTLRNADLSTTAGLQAFDEARERLLHMCADAPSNSQNTEERPELRRRAKAVLFFKHFDSNSALNQINHEFTNIQHRKGETINTLGKDEKDRYEIYKQDVSNEMRRVIGTGQRQGEVLAQTQNSRTELRQDVSKTLADAQKAYTREEQRTLSKVAALAVCEQFAQRPDITTVTQLRGKYAEHAAKLKDWDFYSGCLKQLTDMGISEAHAELYLQRTLEGMKEDFFAGLAQKGLQGADTFTEIDRLVGAYMGELEEAGNSLTFKKTDGVSVDVPIVEAGAAEVSAHLEVARENGISVWKGDDGQYHMTLMKGAKVGLGVGVKVELDSVINAVEAKVGVNAQGSAGCDLTFPNQAQCHMFLSALLSGRAGSDHLGLANNVRSVTSAGVGASAELKLGASISVDEDVDILSFGIGAEAGISALWTTTSDRDRIQHTRTVHGTVSVKVEASLGPEDIQDTAEGIGDNIDNAAFYAGEVAGRVDIAGDVQAAKPPLSAEATLVHREFEEERSVTTHQNGTLEGSERVRAYVLNSKREATALLKAAGVSPKTIEDIQADLQKLPLREDFRIELVSTMRKDAVDAYNAASAGGEKPQIDGKTDFALQEVRLVTEDTYERTNTLTLRLLKLQSGRSLSRTHTESYDAKPALRQAA